MMSPPLVSQSLSYAYFAYEGSRQAHYGGSSFVEPSSESILTFQALQHIEMREVAAPNAAELGERQVLIKVKRIGICGSEIHSYHGLHPATNYPVVQGHEYSGVVKACGSEVEACKVGDKVKLPDDMPLDHGAMIEPSAVGAHASARTDVRGKNVVVSGAGTIGNLVAQFCKARGLELEMPAIDFPTGVVKISLTEDGIPDYDICRNVVKLNDEELPIVVRMFSIKGDSAKQQCRNLMERFGLKMAILTCGTRGSYIFAQDTTSFVETPLVEVADTVGAGDSFSGAFIGSLLNGKTIHDAHTTAVRISAYVCTQNGAMPDIPRSLTI